MINKLKIVKSGCQADESLRIDYLKSLPEFQELYLELMVREGEHYLIRSGMDDVGYAVVNREDMALVEFYLSDKYIPWCSEIFKQVVRNLSLSKAYCKSFDPILLKCCLQHMTSHKMHGMLFRDRLDVPAIELGELRTRQAVDTDIDLLEKRNDGFWASRQEIESFVMHEYVLLFHRADDLVGFGLISRTHPKWDYFDIGMWVHRDHRKQGIGTRIIAHLKSICEENEWIPIAGCAFDNVASQKTLEKNGFVSKYNIIEFTFSD